MMVYLSVHMLPPMYVVGVRYDIYLASFDPNVVL